MEQHEGYVALAQAILSHSHRDFLAFTNMLLVDISRIDLEQGETRLYNNSARSVVPVPEGP